MSVFGLAKSQPAEPAQKGHVLAWPPEHFTVVYTLWFELAGIFSLNSISVAIHLYIIQPQKSKYFCILFIHNLEN